MFGILKNVRVCVFVLGLDLIDQNIPGFGDDALGNDGDGDSLAKSKLNINTISKDKKKPFFKKVCNSLFLFIEYSNCY